MSNVFKMIFGKAGRYQRVFGPEEGQLVLGDLIHKFRPYDPTFDPNNERQSAHNEGERRVLIYILKMVNMTEADAQTIAARAAKVDEEYGEYDE